MVDTLAPKAIIGVMTPAMNTVVQPELEQLRPIGVTNQMQRFRLGGENISDDLPDEALKLMDCNPVALAIGLTTDAGPGGVKKLAKRCDVLAEITGVPVFDASNAVQSGLRSLGARRVAVMTPFDQKVDQHVKANIESGGFNVVDIRGTEAPSLPAICETPLKQIRTLALELLESDCDALAQIGTALPMVNLVDELEQGSGKPVVACNAAVYWRTLRAAGIKESIGNYGTLLRDF